MLRLALAHRPTSDQPLDTTALLMLADKARVSIQRDDLPAPLLAIYGLHTLTLGRDLCPEWDSHYARIQQLGVPLETVQRRRHRALVALAAAASLLEIPLWALAQPIPDVEPLPQNLSRAVLLAGWLLAGTRPAHDSHLWDVRVLASYADMPLPFASRWLRLVWAAETEQRQWWRELDGHVIAN